MDALAPPPLVIPPFLVAPLPLAFPFLKVAIAPLGATISSMIET